MCCGRCWRLWSGGEWSGRGSGKEMRDSAARLAWDAMLELSSIESALSSLATHHELTREQLNGVLRFYADRLKEKNAAMTTRAAVVKGMHAAIMAKSRELTKKERPKRAGRKLKPPDPPRPTGLICAACGCERPKDERVCFVCLSEEVKP